MGAYVDAMLSDDMYLFPHFSKCIQYHYSCELCRILSLAYDESLGRVAHKLDITYYTVQKALFVLHLRAYKSTYMHFHAFICFCAPKKGRQNYGFPAVPAKPGHKASAGCNGIPPAAQWSACCLCAYAYTY